MRYRNIGLPLAAIAIAGVGYGVATTPEPTSPWDGATTTAYVGDECHVQVEVLAGDVLAEADYQPGTLADWEAWAHEACTYHGEYAQVTLWEDHSSRVTNPATGVWWSYPALEGTP
jgi:hypothetical protein